MSVCVMMSPLTMAVALITAGIAWPNTTGFWGSRNELVLFGADGAAFCCAMAAVAAIRPPTARAGAIRTNFKPKAADTSEFSFIPSRVDRVYRPPLNAALATQPLQCQAK